GYDAIAQTREAQRYLENRATSTRPFLLWLAWGPPHNPYETAPAKYRAMYSAETIKLRGNVPEGLREAARKELAGYYAHCTALDDCVGALLETLQQTGLAENTIVVFTSDHGDMLRSLGMIRKQKPFEESTRVPMLFRLPARLGIPPRRLDATINTEDVMPTLLSLCAIPIPGTVEGLDFKACMRGGPDPSGGAALISCVAPFGEFSRRTGGREYRAIRTARYTYARDLNGPWLLFDRQTDPEQLTNLVGRTEHADLQSRLDAQLHEMLAARKDPFLPGPDHIAKWGYKVDGSGTVRYTN
ncbi:MAG: sulfatase-like hydrolase/transferase, partial [Verrucomicrobiota bacterium]